MGSTPGPFVVLDHPLSDDFVPVVPEAYNRPAPGEPSLWCPWTATVEGGFLCFDGTERASPAAWLTNLIDTFLASSAAAAASRDPVFAGFTFDHGCNGAVAACRRDTGELSIIFVTENAVDQMVIMPGLPSAVVWGGLSYKPEEDLARQRSAVRRAAHGYRFAAELRRGGSARFLV
jgi:hypothetical protein